VTQPGDNRSFRSAAIQDQTPQPRTITTTQDKVSQPISVSHRGNPVGPGERSELQVGDARMDQCIKDGQFGLGRKRRLVLQSVPQGDVPESDGGHDSLKL
jgi:hypothetical protein